MNRCTSFIVFGITFTLLAAVWVSIAVAQTGEAPEAVLLEPPIPDAAHTTFIIRYQGEAVPAELQRMLRGLQTAGRVSAIDAESEPGRVFVLGEEDALLALRHFPGVAAVDQADALPLIPDVAPEPEGPTLESPVTFYLALRAGLHAAQTEQLLAYLQMLRVTGQIVDFSIADLTVQVIALPSARDRLKNLPVVLFLTEASAEAEREILSISADGHITGVVTADDGGAPIPNTWVYAYQPSPYVYKSGQTNASGVYSITVPAGSYRVWFVPPDHHIPEYYNNVPYSNSSAATLVTVSGGAVTANINAGLARGAQIVGRVTDQMTASPLPSIHVSALGGNNYDASSYTLANGVFTTTPGLPPGSYRVSFTDYSGLYATEYYNNAYRPGLATLVNVTTTNRIGINAGLVKAAVVTGTVTGSGPLHNIYVYAYYGEENEYTNSASTDVNGRYRIAGLGPIPYKFWFYDPNGIYLAEWHNNKPDWGTANPVNLMSGITTTINASLVKAGAITGTVTAEGSGAPLNNIGVTAYDAVTGNYVASANTNASGIYRIGGLAPANYKLRFQDNTGTYLTEWHNNKPNQASADPINVSAGVTRTVNAQLALAGVLRGTVTAEGSGTPLSNINVRAYDASTGSQVGNNTTDASGIYRIGGLSPGTYKLRFQDNNGVYLTEYHNNKPDLDSADPVAVSIGTTTTVNAALQAGARITGRVTEAGSGAGIASVSISANRMDGSGPSGSATTDANGYYTTTALYTGIYRVWFNPPAPYYSEYYDNQYSSGLFTPVTVTAPLTRTNINARLRRGHAISGTVTGPGPLQNVSIYAYQGASNYYNDWAYTASNGAYQIGPLDPGQYRLFFYSPDLHASEWYSNAAHYQGAQALPVAGNVPNINAALEQGGRITGTVTGPAGVPLANTGVEVYEAGSGQYLSYGRTDANGRYATEIGLNNGWYRVFFSAPEGYASEWYNDQMTRGTATFISVTLGVTKTNINAQLAALAVGAISGTLTAADTGQRLSMWVYAYDANGNSVKSAYAFNGAYLLSGLAPGSYRVWFAGSGLYPSRYYDNKTDLASANPVPVTAGTVTRNINQAFPRGGTIAGLVTTGSGGIPGVYVYASRIGGGSSASTYTGADGTYRLEGLNAGGYRVEFRPPPPFIGEWYNDANSASTALTVTVNMSAITPDINAVLATGGTIAGRVTAADTGAPIPGAGVSVYRAADGSYLLNTSTDLDGNYQTRGLPAGGYKVKFDAGPWYRYRPEWYNNAPSSGAAVTVTVPGSGMVSNINAALEQGGSLSGWITDAKTGLPLYGVYVTLYDSLTGSYAGEAYSNSWGFYQATALPAGRYKVYFSKSGYTGQWYREQYDVDMASPVMVNVPNDTPNINARLQPPSLYLPLAKRRS
jgi:5-hydroxyisourate hydrolase-like protein (transthyretin family)